MGLSLNPMTWTPSNLAETVVEGITGSEAAGDIAGLFGAAMTGDILGVASQTFDLGGNVISGFGRFAEGVWNSAKQGFAEFSNPGQIYSPDFNRFGRAGGYAAGQASGPFDTGMIGNPFGGLGGLGLGAGQGLGGAGGSLANLGAKMGISNPDFGGAGDAGGAVEQANALNFSDMDRIMNNPNLSLETKIMLVMLKLQRAKREEVETQFREAHASSKSAAGMGKGVEQDKAKASSQEALALLQKSQQELNELTQLTSGLSKMFHDMKMSTIQNIR